MSRNVCISNHDIETGGQEGERHRRVRNQTDGQIFRKEEKVLLADRGWHHCSFIIRKLPSDTEEEQRTNSKRAKAKDRRATAGEKKGLHGASKRKSTVHSRNAKSLSDSAPRWVPRLRFRCSTTQILSMATSSTSETRPRVRGSGAKQPSGRKLGSTIHSCCDIRMVTLFPHPPHCLLGSWPINPIRNSGPFRAWTVNIAERPPPAWARCPP